MKISAAEYARMKGVSKRAINKRIQKNIQEGLPGHTGLPGVRKVEQINISGQYNNIIHFKHK